MISDSVTVTKGTDDVTVSTRGTKMRMGGGVNKRDDRRTVYKMFMLSPVQREDEFLEVTERWCDVTERMKTGTELRSS